MHEGSSKWRGLCSCSVHEGWYARAYLWIAYAALSICMRRCGGIPRSDPHIDILMLWWLCLREYFQFQHPKCSIQTVWLILKVCQLDICLSLSNTDLALYGDDPTRKRVLFQQVRQACEKYGFFQIINHQVPVALRQAILEQSRDLFSLPKENKERYNKGMRQINWSQHTNESQLLIPKIPLPDIGAYKRGYESLRARGDLQEAYYLGKDLSIDHPAVVANKFSHGPNKYPTEVKTPELFKKVVDEYHAHLSRLAEDILKVLAQTLALPSDWFESQGFCHDPIANLRLLHYPTLCQAADTKGMLRTERISGKSYCHEHILTDGKKQRKPMDFVHIPTLAPSLSCSKMARAGCKFGTENALNGCTWTRYQGHSW